MRRLFASVLCVTTLFACDAFSGNDSDEEQPAPSADADASASASDAGAEAASAVDGGAAGAGGLVDGTFEQSSATRCAGLLAYRASGTPDPLAKSGALACRVCTNASATGTEYGGIYFTVAPGQPGKYRLTLSVRKAPAPAASPGDVRLKFIAYRGADVVGEEPLTATPSVIYPEYRAYELTFVLPAAVERVEAHVILSDTPNECILVDDVVLTRE